ncbi:2OG-Fe(II) oxygenase [Luteimonas sp. XNQY3]|nr:2OG-Fe(II) oxygenase [Luteimonas sp. XNQY3]MCD9007162.1 2OG-Fe(II) oxygenase [Luteimonas sp. XNQY3]
MTTPAQAIAQRLAALGGSGNFATRFAIEADPQLHVEGVGAVPLPVTMHTAHRLCAAAQPAHHGYKDQTRLDPRVRDTWEIQASRLRFDSPQWSAVLERALARIGRDLGLPPGMRLDAQLHNLLVYAPGQFFAVHQDSEKADGMLGTLVVTLPSKFSGGEFVVSHQGQTLRTRGSAGKLGMVAFYADCHHEVRPVKQGYRVVLTWNLVARGGAPVADLPAQALDALADAVRRFWHTPALPRWTSDTATEPPDRLVYLLDHQYTQSGLSWDRLKGADAPRVAALRRVAERLDAEIFLALADVHETWQAEDDYPDHDRWGYAEDEEELDADGVAEPTLGDLIDSEIELRHGIAPDGGALASEANFVADAELCMNRLSVDCTPFRSEHEGYMGNYGNTVDRWYHRAAVVLWPRERAFVIRARQSPRWGIEQVAERLAAGDAGQAQQWAHSLLPFWNRGAAKDSGLLGTTLAVAAALDDAPTAAGLLAPFALVKLMPDATPSVLRLLERQGVEWCKERLQQWSKPYQTDEDQLHWLARTLPVLAHAWSTAAPADGRALAAALVQERWDWLRKHAPQVQARIGGSARVKALAATSPALLGVLRSSHDAGLGGLRQRVIDALLSRELPLQVPLGVLRAAATATLDVVALGLVPVHEFCTRVLATRLAQPERADDDWSIAPPADDVRLGELGEPLARFLASPAQQRFEWPLAQAKRQLIHQFIDRHELAVRHETRRSGRPYTLVLEKTPALFEREAAERRQWTGDLAWLRQVADRFARPEAEGQ